MIQKDIHPPRTDKVKSRATVVSQVSDDEVNLLGISTEDLILDARPNLSIRGKFERCLIGVDQP